MENHDKNYHFFIKRLKKYTKQLDAMYEDKVNAISVGKEREIFMEITKMESRITELRDLFFHFELHPKAVKQKTEQI